MVLFTNFGLFFCIGWSKNITLTVSLNNDPILVVTDVCLNVKPKKVCIFVLKYLTQLLTVSTIGKKNPNQDDGGSYNSVKSI